MEENGVVGELDEKTAGKDGDLGTRWAAETKEKS